MSNGVGGDAMIIVWEPSSSSASAEDSANSSGKVIGYNGSGRSPKGMSYDQLIASLRGSALIPIVGPLPVSTPGAAKAWCDMVEQHGSGMRFEQILAPAIQAARTGFPVTQVIAAEWRDTVLSLIANNDTITSHGQFPNALDGFLLTYTIPDPDAAEVEAADIDGNSAV